MGNFGGSGSVSRSMRALFFVLAAVVAAGVFLALRTAVAEGVAADKADKADKADAPKTVRVFSSETGGYVVVPRVVKTDEEWKRQLSPLQYEVTRKQGTERAGTGALLHNHGKGVYQCVACGNDLFHSDAKFESGTGWPSFWKPIAKENVEEHLDRSLFMNRIEVVCRRCGAHLGHVFPDGPPPTGERHCLNSVSLGFTPNGDALPDPLRRGGAEAAPAA